MVQDCKCCTNIYQLEKPNRHNGSSHCDGHSDGVDLRQRSTLAAECQRQRTQQVMSCNLRHERRTLHPDLLSKQEAGGIGTFNRSPLGFPPEEPPAVDLVLLVAAHHCERDHFLPAGSEIDADGQRLPAGCRR